MMNVKKYYMVVFALLVVFIFAFATVTVASEAVNLQGQVLVDDNGDFILQSGGQTYILDGQDLEDLEGQQVKVSGTVKEDEDGRKILVVDLAEVIE